MKQYTAEELKTILENHKHWLNDDCEGWEDMSADLRYANLRNANLCDADLRYANLCNADLRHANLRNANLCDADLCYANLRYADLCYANLRYADLRNADLRDADLRNADLRYANLRYAKNIPFVPMACPDHGSFTAFKRCGIYIVELKIPADAKRSSATGRKCRADKAEVIAFFNEKHETVSPEFVQSNYDASFIYRIGETVSVDDFEENRFIECAPGIHFFINFEEAVNYAG